MACGVIRQLDRHSGMTVEADECESRNKQHIGEDTDKRNTCSWSRLQTAAQGQLLRTFTLLTFIYSFISKSFRKTILLRRSKTRKSEGHVADICNAVRASDCIPLGEARRSLCGAGKHYRRSRRTIGGTKHQDNSTEIRFPRCSRC
jgi:hypothetical protein